MGSTVTRDDRGALEELADGIESELASARAHVEGAIAAARSRHLEEAAASLLASSRPNEPLAALSAKTSTSSSAAGRQLEDALRIVRRLPGDTSAAAVERC